MKNRTATIIAVSAVVAVVAATLGGFVIVRELRDARNTASEAEARADARDAQLEELQRRLDGLESSSGGGLGGLDGLLDGGMGDLFGGLGGLGGDGGVPGARCITGGGGLGGLGGLEDLFGEGGLGGLEDLFGEGGLGGLEDLFGEGGLGDLEDLFGARSPDRPATASRPTQELPDDPDELVAVAADQVAEMRELDFTEPISVDFLDDAAIEARLRELITESYTAEDATIDSEILAAIGAVPHGTDMLETTLALYESQVAGFYSPETGELVVRSADEISASDKVILAHEILHALADQAIGLPDLDEDFDGDEDGALATLAVIEGDATLLMNQWALASLEFSEMLSMQSETGFAEAQAALADLPPYLASQLMYPYEDGLEYICEQWMDDGWAGVDKAYIDPPTTTAQVLWFDHPGATNTPDALRAPSGYAEAYTTTFGAAPLTWLLAAPGGDDDAALGDVADRAEAWGGGQLTLWRSGNEPAVGLSLVDRGTGPALCETITDWYAASFPDAAASADGATATYTGDAQDAVIECDGDSVRVGIGADTSVAGAIAAG